MDKNEIYDTLNKAYFSDDMHEKDVISRLPTLLEGAKLFVDIGASLGQYTFYANNHIRNGEIIAIEADPIRVEKLKANCEEWEKQSNGNKITVINAAVSHMDGVSKFYITNSSVSGGLFKHSMDHLKEEDSRRINWEEITIETFTLDAILKDRNPDLIKMDIEGSELRALKGAQKILQKGTAEFLIELHNWEDPEGQKNAAQVIELMTTYGYGSRSFYGKKLFSRGLKSEGSKVGFLRRIKDIFG
jgi:FkbM family methyltransferase